MTRRIFTTLILSAAVLTATYNCLGQTPAAPAPQAKPATKTPPPPHDHSHMTKTTKESSPAANYFTDVQLIN
ncbi:MAG TPA: hypothetical protein VFY67_12845, partial [Pyrinomonadaceae bacterium]|nr:hypothetical protein [Pyrinomonadaceae bacterium]